MRPSSFQPLAIGHKIVQTYAIYAHLWKTLGQLLPIPYENRPAIFSKLLADDEGARNLFRFEADAPILIRYRIHVVEQQLLTAIQQKGIIGIDIQE